MIPISEALSICKKNAGNDTRGFFDDENGVQTSSWLLKSLNEIFEACMAKSHCKYQNITTEQWDNLKSLFLSVIDNKVKIKYVPKNTTYEVVALAKSKTANGKWYLAAIYRDTNETYVRFLCDFEKFDIPEKI